MSSTGITTYVQDTSDMLLNAANNLLNTIATYLPHILGALAIFILGLIIATAFKKTTKKVLKWVGFSKLVEKSKIDDSLLKVGFKQGIINVLAGIVYWIILLVFLSAVFDALGLSAVVKTFSQLIAYLPNLILAVITIILSLMVGRFVKGIIITALEKLHITYAKMVAVVAEYLVVLLGASIAASQLGLDISIITTNVTVIIIGVITLLVVTLGIGSRTAISNIISGYYTKQYYKTGEVVKLLGYKGKIKEVNNMVIVLETEEGNVFIPNEEVLKRGSIK